MRKLKFTALCLSLALIFPVIAFSQSEKPVSKYIVRSGNWLKLNEGYFRAYPTLNDIFPPPYGSFSYKGDSLSAEIFKNLKKRPITNANFEVINIAGCFPYQMRPIGGAGGVLSALKLPNLFLTLFSNLYASEEEYSSPDIELTSLKLTFLDFLDDHTVYNKKTEGYNNMLRFSIAIVMENMSAVEKNPEILSRLQDKQRKMIEKEKNKAVLDQLNSFTIGDLE
jgi:hypothetical protein